MAKFSMKDGEIQGKMDKQGITIIANAWRRITMADGKMSREPVVEMNRKEFEELFAKFVEQLKP